MRQCDDIPRRYGVWPAVMWRTGVDAGAGIGRRPVLDRDGDTAEGIGRRGHRRSSAPKGSVCTAIPDPNLATIFSLVSLGRGSPCQIMCVYAAWLYRGSSIVCPGVRSGPGTAAG